VSSVSQWQRPGVLAKPRDGVVGFHGNRARETTAAMKELASSVQRYRARRLRAGIAPRSSLHRGLGFTAMTYPFGEFWKGSGSTGDLQVKAISFFRRRWCGNSDFTDARNIEAGMLL
jgi:hypothetical protein